MYAILQGDSRAKRSSATREKQKALKRIAKFTALFAK